MSGSILLSTVSNFLDFFKIEAGKQLDIVRTEIHVSTLVRDVHCIIEAMIGRSDDLQLLPPELCEVPSAVMGDPDRLCGILLNLYTNAAKFTKRGFIALRVRAYSGDFVPGVWTGFIALTLLGGDASGQASGQTKGSLGECGWSLRQARPVSGRAPARALRPRPWINLETLIPHTHTCTRPVVGRAPVQAVRQRARSAGGRRRRQRRRQHPPRVARGGHRLHAAQRRAAQCGRPTGHGERRQRNVAATCVCLDAVGGGCVLGQLHAPAPNFRSCMHAKS